MNGDDDALDPKKNPLIGLEDEGFDLRTDEERERDEALFADHRALGLELLLELKVPEETGPED
jgi:hypothetical protein